MNTQMDALNEELEKERNNSLELVKSMQESERSNQENAQQLQLQYEAKLEELKVENVNLLNEFDARVANLAETHGTQLVTITYQLEQSDLEKASFSSEYESLVSSLLSPSRLFQHFCLFEPLF
jgi:hypothetical protein